MAEEILCGIKSFPAPHTAPARRGGKNPASRRQSISHLGHINIATTRPMEHNSIILKCIFLDAPGITVEKGLQRHLLIDKPRILLRRGVVEEMVVSAVLIGD